MKHSFFALLKAAIFGRFNTNSDAPDKKPDSTTSPSTELKTINVQKDFEENGLSCPRCGEFNEAVSRFFWN